MNRRIFLMSVAGTAGCSGRKTARLNVYNWSNYIAPDTISNFERETGVRVRYAIYESNEEMLAKVMTGNSGWDIVFPSNYIVKPLRENRLLQPLRRDWLPNAANLDSAFRAPAWDPDLAWCVPYAWGACGILYNKSQMPTPKGWADLWDARLKGRMTMLDDPGDVLGACLKRFGRSINSVYRADLENAKQRAIEQKPLLRAYLNAEVRDQVVSGDILAAQSWVTMAEQAIAAAPSLGFVFPEEGFSLYADNAVVLRESRRAELAHRFVDYLLRPEVSAAVVRATLTATANGVARAMLPDNLRNSPTLYPPTDVLQRGEWFEALPPAGQRLRDRIWTEIKAA